MDARQLHLYEHAENGRAVALAELVDRHPTLDLDWLIPEGGYETALGVAARHGGAPGQLRCAELLLSRGASTSAATYQGLLPLTAAAISGYDKMVSLLLERKADIGAMDFSLCGATALHAVCGDAAGDAHDAVANAAEALRKRVVSLDATAARNAEFLDTLIATCHLDRDARARKGLVQRTIDAAVVPPPMASPEAAAAGE